MEYRIFAENYSALVRLATRLNKRAAKLGLDPIIITKTGEEEIANDDGVTVDVMFLVSIEGHTPVIQGWEFVATLQHTPETGNIIRTMPAWDACLPERFRTADASNCDHCKLNRKRIDTFVVYNGETDRYAQVGRNCLADFVGSDKMGHMAEMASIMSLITEAAESMGEQHGERAETKLMLESAVAWAAEAMFRGGWISRTKAHNEGKTATVDYALMAMDAAHAGRTCTPRACGFDYSKCLQHFKPSAEATELAQKALAWAPEWIERENKRPQQTDYVWNMSIVLANDVIPVRSYGLAASILGAYQREMDYARQRAVDAQEMPESNWVGTPGERTNALLSVVAFRYLDNDFGVSTLVTYSDPSGNILKWFASGKQFPVVGAEADLEFTIKAHTEFNGRKETSILRVKPFLNKADKAAKAKAKKAAKAAYTAAQKASDEAWDNLATVGRDVYNELREQAQEAYRAWEAL